MSKNENKQIFAYKGTAISFDFGDEHKLINATQMAKPFKKRVSHFLENAATKEYIAALGRCRNSVIAINQPVRVVKGGSKKQGTWMERRLALRFAQWLNPDFAIWVDEQIINLLTPKPLAGYSELLEQLKHDLRQELPPFTPGRPKNYHTIAEYFKIIGVETTRKERIQKGTLATYYANLGGEKVVRVTDCGLPRNAYPHSLLDELFYNTSKEKSWQLF